LSTRQLPTLVTSTPPGLLESQVRRALADADSNLTVTSVRTLEEQVENAAAIAQ
jgi:hypothetical protein